MAVVLTPAFRQKSNIDQAAVPLTADTVDVGYGTVVQAHPANTGLVYVGLAGVTVSGDSTGGYALAAGRETFVSRAEADEVGKIYVIADTDNQVVCWRGV